MTYAEPQWTTISENGTTLIVQHAHHQAVAGALLRGEGCVALDKGGRGDVLRFALEGGSGIVRKCRRGGVIRRLIKDSYLFANRPLREWHIHTYLYENGLAVPEPLGLRWERRGATFSGALATREIADAQTLLSFLSAPENAQDTELARVGALTRRMHDLGVVHGDLQVQNVLVSAAGPYLIDFGNARRKNPLTRFHRAQDLLRFRRSLLKNGLSELTYERVREGYGAFTLPAGLDLGYRVKAALSDMVFGRRPRGGNA